MGNNIEISDEEATDGASGIRSNFSELSLCEQTELSHLRTAVNERYCYWLQIRCAVRKKVLLTDAETVATDDGMREYLRKLRKRKKKEASSNDLQQVPVKLLTQETESEIKTMKKKKRKSVIDSKSIEPTPGKVKKSK